MFHDKASHIMFCAECEHVGWPHDAPIMPDKSDDGKNAAKGTDKSASDEKKSKIL